MAASTEHYSGLRAGLLQAPLPTAQGRWASAVLQLGGSLDIFCVGCWCPCILYAHNVAQMHGESRFSMSTCLAYLSIPLAAGLLTYFAAWGLALLVAPAALVALPVVGAVAARAALATLVSPTRSELRWQEGIPGSAAADWALWCLLPSCMLCQEAAQLAARQQLQSAARSGKGTAAPVDPPPPQFMQDNRPGPSQQPRQQGGEQQLACSDGYAALPTAAPCIAAAHKPQFISNRC